MLPVTQISLERATRVRDDASWASSLHVKFVKVKNVISYFIEEKICSLIQLI